MTQHYQHRGSGAPLRAVRHRRRVRCGQVHPRSKPAHPWVYVIYLRPTLLHHSPGSRQTRDPPGSYHSPAMANIALKAHRRLPGLLAHAGELRRYQPAASFAASRSHSVSGMCSRAPLYTVLTAAHPATDNAGQHGSTVPAALARCAPCFCRLMTTQPPKLLQGRARGWWHMPPLACRARPLPIADI